MCNRRRGRASANVCCRIWGDGSGGSQYATGSIALDLLGWSPTQTHWVYGRIPGSQATTVPGAYGDSIAVTLTCF